MWAAGAASMIIKRSGDAVNASDHPQPTPQFTPMHQRIAMKRAKAKTAEAAFVLAAVLQLVLSGQEQVTAKGQNRCG